MASLVFLGFTFRLNQGVTLEQSTFVHPTRYAALIGIRALTIAAVRWRTAMHAKSSESEVQFEEEPETVIQRLGLHRDLVSEQSLGVQDRN